MAVDAGAWCTLNEIKYHLHIGISDTTYDTLLEQLINSSYKILEQYIGHPIKSATYTEYYDGDNTNKLLLRKWPIVSVTSIHVDPDREFNSDDLINASNYYVDTEHGEIEIFQGLAAGPAWFDKGIKNVKVIYVAGYATIPNDIRQASIWHVAWMFRRSDTEGTTAQSLGGKSETYDERAIPEWLRHVLAPYKERVQYGF